ncbi:MAG: hypothetical protein M3314_15755 [Actinomycetota bacterium]|jgi:hypothetical protein|nr:hypothetical protein [Actinomycetota bacterium]
MDIEQFYDEDERRRTSAELQFGQDWHDAHGRRYELNWIEDTGELYVMQDEMPDMWVDPFGDFLAMPLHTEDLQVRVLATVHDKENVLRLLDGWEQAMGQPDSVSWLVERLRTLPTG